jgi:hypothetical protein
VVIVGINFIRNHADHGILVSIAEAADTLDDFDREAGSC